MEQFRIFLSYSHEDRELVECLAEALRSRGLLPIWDKHIRPGTAFTDGIKELIVHAHIFMPVMTKHSQHRPWVHQESGYAMALGIPVLPLAVDELPGDMIAQLQAMVVKPDLSDLGERLDEVNLEDAVFSPPTKAMPISEAAEWPERRAELMARYAKRVIELGYRGRVRVRAGGLSMFCIPDKDLDDPAWAAHDGTRPRGDYLHHLQREQRQLLERHARDAGCDLLIHPRVVFPEVNHIARRARLKTLLEFLESMPDERISVVCTARAADAHIVAVGDWFLAEARLRQAGQGWRQTLFTWHGPTVLQGIRKLDSVFESCLLEKGVTRAHSRREAIREIGAIWEEAESAGTQDPA